MFRFEGPPSTVETTPDALSETRAVADPEGAVLCAHCGHGITSPGERISIDGRHLHVFTNPDGIIFEIGCFRTAPGCREIGPAVREHTWFPGCAWRVALCANCGIHLGWAYVGRDNFYGLILERLIFPD